MLSRRLGYWAALLTQNRSVSQALRRVGRVPIVETVAMVRSGLVRRLSEKRKIGVAEAELIVAALSVVVRAACLGR